MAPLRLRFWNMRWLGVRYFPRSGRGIVWAHSKDTLGAAYLAHHRWYALWYYGGKLCLQVGRKRWYAEDGWDASLAEVGDSRVFKLRKGAECVFEIRYMNPGLRWWNKADATRDDLDDLMEDFFLWVARTWANKTAHKNLLLRGRDRIRSI
jgi:hypothetical protein